MAPSTPAWRWVNALSQSPASDELAAALGPLTQRRGAAPPLIYSRQHLDPERDAALWCEQQGQALAGASQVMVLCDPAAPPFELVHALSLERAVGLLPFEGLEPLASYARRAAQGPGGARASLSALTGGDGLGQLLASSLICPLVEAYQGAHAPFSVPGLKALLRAPRRPGGVLLVGGHGWDWQRDGGPAELQGAPYDGAAWLTPADLPPDAEAVYEAGAVVLLGCGAVGTPARRAWAQAAGGPARLYPGGDTLAALPRALLRHPRGPLCVVGHVDLWFSTSLMGLSGAPPDRLSSPGVEPLAALVRCLMLGRSVGEAGAGLRGARLRAEAQMGAALRRLRAKDLKEGSDEAARALLRWQDARGWLTLGDPAVCVAERVSSP